MRKFGDYLQGITFQMSVNASNLGYENLNNPQNKQT